jgi:catechol 2,3-dioxygenase-like lactoylglutathione lyase family enzyme
MKITRVTPILNVSDVPASIAWFERLGWERHFTWNDAGMIAAAADANGHGPAQFAGIGCGEAGVFLCHAGQGSRGVPPDIAAIARAGGRIDDDSTGGVWMSWWVKTPAEVDEAHRLAIKHGVAVVWPPTDEPWGVRECRIVHPDGHTFRISSQLG